VVLLRKKACYFIFLLYIYRIRKVILDNFQYATYSYRKHSTTEAIREKVWSRKHLSEQCFELSLLFNNGGLTQRITKDMRGLSRVSR